MDGSASLPQQSQGEKARGQAPSRKEQGPGPVCAACGHQLPVQARFCPECGLSQTDRPCPHCGAAVRAGAEICEACGLWLKEGYCHVCNTPLPPEGLFCPECGNPRAGNVCPKCHRQVVADYCPDCRLPLTDQARDYEATLRADVRFKAYFEACDEQALVEAEIARLESLGMGAGGSHRETAALGPPDGGTVKNGPDPAESEEARVLSALSALAGRHREGRGLTPGSKATPVPVPAQSEDASGVVDQVQAEIDRRREALKALRARREALKRELKNPPLPEAGFASPQEMRRYHMATKPPSYKGWLCNAFCMLHADPLHCERPGDGGRWLSQEEYDAMEWTTGYER